MKALSQGSSGVKPLGLTIEGTTLEWVVEFSVRLPLFSGWVLTFGPAPRCKHIFGQRPVKIRPALLDMLSEKTGH